MQRGVRACERILLVHIDWVVSLLCLFACYVKYACVYCMELFERVSCWEGFCSREACCTIQEVKDNSHSLFT